MTKDDSKTGKILSNIADGINSVTNKITRETLDCLR